MPNDKKLFTLRPDTSTGEAGDMVMTHGDADLAARKAAADQAGRSYTISDVPK